MLRWLMVLWLTLFTGVLALGQPTLPATATTPATAASTAGDRTVVIELEGEINNYTYDDLVRRVSEARDMGANRIILEIDSYGGAVTAGLDISRFIKQQEIPVVAYVKQKAISAGAMIAVSCREIYAAPHALIGDCAPILVTSGQGLTPMQPTERAKFESPVIEEFRDSARKNGYNPALLEAMVVLDKEVYWVKNAKGERRIVGTEGYKKLEAEGGWEPVLPDRNPIDSKDSLLTLGAELAHDLGLVRRLAASPEEVASANGWVITGQLHRTAGDRLIALLSSDAVRSLLVSALVLSIFAAFKMPGTGLPEAAVVVCLALLLGVPLMTGYAQWWEIILVLLGVVLLALEIFVIPGTGIAGIAGVIFILFGLLMTFVPPAPSGPGVLPTFQAGWDGLERGVILLVIGLTGGLIGASILARFLPKVPIFGRLILTRTIAGGVADSEQVQEVPGAVASTTWVKIGSEGQAMTELRPGGNAQFTDPGTGARRMTDVISESGYLSAGTPIRVHEIRGSTVIVRKLG